MIKIIEIDPVFTNTTDRQLFADSLNQVDFEWHANRPKNETEFIHRAKDADAIMVSNIPITKSILDQCPKLKMISVAFTGLDHIDLIECERRGIIVENAAGYSTQSVAELTLGLMIDLLRKITELDKSTRTSSDRNGFIGNELSGKTVGIIGAGAIGTKVGKILYSFGCEVFFTGRKMKSDTLWGNYLPLDELLKVSDIITLHVPLTKETENIINQDSISNMKDGVYVVNTSRGKTVDYNALSDALKSGKVAGAGIDVYEMEPPIPTTHPLLSAPNCVLTPHIAYATHQAFTLRAEIVSNNIIRWLENNYKL